MTKGDSTVRGVGQGPAEFGSLVCSRAQRAQRERTRERHCHHGMEAEDVLAELHGAGSLDEAERLDRTVCKIQAHVRGWRCRKWMREQQQAARKIQAVHRGNLARARLNTDARQSRLAAQARVPGTGRKLPPSAQKLERQKKIASLAVGRIVATTNRAKISMEELFQRIDEDGSGEIDVTEFRKAMLAMEIPFTDEEIDALLSQLDTDGGGSLTLDEFVPKLLAFQQQRANDAGVVLSKICHYLNAQGETAAAVFSRLDADGGGSLDLGEFHAALNTLGIAISYEAAAEVMDELDMDGGGDLELRELTAKLDEYRRSRRAFAARVLGGVLDHTERTKTSVTRVFARVDSDGSGDLDIDEFQEAMRTMGQALTPLEVQEVMAELDIDGSGTIEAPEFIDKLKQFAKERTDDISKCKELFAEIDADGSGYLCEKEVKQLVVKMGFEEQMKTDKKFVKKLIHQIEQSDLKSGGIGLGTAATTANEPGNDDPGSSDGQVSCDELVRWYLDIGKYHLKRPEFKSASVSKPTPAERQELFAQIDVDGSGELDLSEVQNAVTQLWPNMAPKHTERAFEAADEDGGGLVSLEEFKKLLGFIVWFNEKRHQIQEVEEHFGDTIDRDMFYFACSSLGEPMSDTAAEENFNRLCDQTGHVAEEGVPLSNFLGWLARRHYVDDEPAENESEEEIEMMEDADELSSRLAEHTGEFGDVHLQDLASVLGGHKAAKTAATKVSSSVSKKVRSVARRVVECVQLITAALRFATETNNCFPDFDDDQLRRLALMMRKEEYFGGQNIVTQGEDDADYYVLRRGKVEVHINGPGVVGNLQWGMGFGEVALVLGTKRTATIHCLTPCEVYRLTRAQYESEVASMAAEARHGQLQKVILQFWDLCTGPDGSHRPAVDFAVYLKLHIRVSKTLTEDEEDYDEDDERDSARVDWAEDMERYGLGTAGTQDRGTFVSSMYQLVDLWAEDRQISYGTFMSWLFDNIAVWDDRQNDNKGAWVFAKMGKVECIGEKFNNMKAEAISVHEKFVGEAVTAAADEARNQFEKENARLAEEQRLAGIAEQERLAKEKIEAAEGEKRRKSEEKARKKAEAKALADRAQAEKKAAREEAKRQRENPTKRSANGAVSTASRLDSFGTTGGVATDGTGVSGSEMAGADSGREGHGKNDMGGGAFSGGEFRNHLAGAGDRVEGHGKNVGGAAFAGNGGQDGGSNFDGHATAGGDDSDDRCQNGNAADGRRDRNGGSGFDGRDRRNDPFGKSDQTNGKRGSKHGFDGNDGARNARTRDKKLQEAYSTGVDGGRGSRGSHNGQHRSAVGRQYGEGAGNQGHGVSNVHQTADQDWHSGASRGMGADSFDDMYGAGGKSASFLGALNGFNSIASKNDVDTVSFGGTGSEGGSDESMYTAQLGTSELLNNALRPLKPSRQLLAKRARQQREEEMNAGELPPNGQDLFSSRSFKRVQTLTRWPIQPLWPVDSKGAMHPIDNPDRAVHRGFRPTTDGRPGSMCGIKRLFEDEIMQHCSGMTMGERESLHHRTILTTPGGEHVNDVTLDGADSNILRCTVEQGRSNLSASFSINDVPSSTGTSSAAALRQGTLEPLVNRGIKVAPNQKCLPSVRRPGAREMDRIRTFSKRMGECHGQFLNWRVSGAFGPREMEKLTMINIDREPALDADEIMHMNVVVGATITRTNAVPKLKRWLRGEPDTTRNTLSMQSRSSAELDSLSSSPLLLFDACATSTRCPAPR